jgi:hypothetical protein
MGNASWANVAIGVLLVFMLLLLASVPAIELWGAIKERAARRREEQLERDARLHTLRAGVRVAQMLDAIPVTQDCPIEERLT